MELIPLKSEIVQSGSELESAIALALERNESKLKSGDILVVASKVVSYSQGLLYKIGSQEEFRKLILSEADEILDEGDMVLTIKNKILIPNAGIDNSNTPKGEVILWPSAPFTTARNIRKQLNKKFDLNQLGIVISDSHCQPLRMGTSGIAIAWAGFEGVKDERGAKDLYDKEMKYTKLAVADNLASAANLLMGETDAGIPFVIIRGFNAKFTNAEFEAQDYFISPDQCLYRSLYNFY